MALNLRFTENLEKCLSRSGRTIVFAKARNHGELLLDARLILLQEPLCVLAQACAVHGRPTALAGR